jgi:ATP-dependent 26S proteasome regulatory subunit
MLFTHLKLGSPAVWFKTQEFSRSLENITKFNFRTYFTIHPQKAFSQFVDGSWKSVLVDVPREDGSVTPSLVWDTSLCFDYISKNNFDTPITFIVQIIGKPDQIIPMYIPTVAANSFNYREIFWKDEVDTKAIQFLFISTVDAPEEYSSFFKTIEDSVPDLKELSTVVSHISESSHGRFVQEDQINDIVKSGIGLTESDFIDLCLHSVILNNKLDPKYIYDQKMKNIKQNGILEIIKPQITFDNIGGLDNIKDLIRRTALLWNNRDKAKSFGITPIRRVLMVGIPGTGKSAICQATAAELGLDLARTGISQVMNSFVGQSEQNMRAVFKQIKMMTPLCVWIDEFGRDLSGGQSSSHVDGGTTDRVHGEFLTGLQELPEDTFLMCAANQLEHLKPEMLRADRFDKIVFVGLPSYSERKEILNIYLNNIETDHEYDYDALARVTENFTGAEISSLIKEVKFYVVTSDFRPIVTSDILSYAPRMKNTIWNKHRDMVKSMYQYALEQWDWASSEQMDNARNVITGRSINKEELTFKI